MGALLDALGINTGDCVALVGAGGKTTLAHRLIQEAVADGQRALFGTTTRVWQPAAGVFDLLITDFAGQLPLTHRLDGSVWKSACVLGETEGPVDASPVPGAGMPTLQTKRRGLSPDAICALHTRKQLLIVEADGARGLRLKAPAAHEPVIPACADVVCVLASLTALGRPLDERIAYRADRVAALTRTMPGAIITAELLQALLLHPEGGRKGIPPGARSIAVLTGGMPSPGPAFEQALRTGGFDGIVIHGL
jgi:probable selenium-dependent hydroxylase accessory protein YqeC